MLFSEIRGQVDIKRTLLHAIQSGHVASAQLFFGREGSSNLAMAMAYATYLNCDNPKETDACGECPSCSKSLKMVHPDIHFMFPYRSYRKEGSDSFDEKIKMTALTEWRLFVKENAYGTLKDWQHFAGADNKLFFISVDESRYLTKQISLKSFEGKYKVVILWLPELMRTESANALLKVLEEPPSKTIFLLVTHSTENILLTIQSRTQLVRIPSFTEEELVEEMVEKHSLSAEKAKNIALQADGNLNEALRLVLEIQDDNHAFFREWMLECFNKNGLKLVKMADQFQTLGRDGQKNLLAYGLTMLRESLALRMGDGKTTKHGDAERDFIGKFSNFMREDNLPRLAQLLSQASFHIERNANAKIIWMDLSIQISGLLKKG